MDIPGPVAVPESVPVEVGGVGTSPSLPDSPSTNIWGGSNATGSFISSHVLIARSVAKAETWCGGTLIAPQWVLTAGHCLDDMDQWINPPTQYEQRVVVGLGIKDRTQTTNPDHQYINIAQIIRHPRYVSPSIFDVALLRLVSPAQITVNIATMGISRDINGYEPAIGSSGYIIGWGRQNEYDCMVGPRTTYYKPNILQQAATSIVSIEPSNAPNDFDKDMMWLDATTGKRSCSGDSGGGFFYGRMTRIPCRPGRICAPAFTPVYELAGVSSRFVNGYMRVGAPQISNWICDQTRNGSVATVQGCP